jgi:hypothetical protein
VIEKSDEPLVLQAIRLKRSTTMEVSASTHSRPWMESSLQRFANRCLPLLIANQSGWSLVNDARFSVVWKGGDEREQTVITFDGDAPSEPPSSHFGLGIITWDIPYLFRTPPGWNLLARGPANAPKDGITPLEGIIETDWTSAPFTMNWKLTRPDQEVVFEPGDVICTIVPQRRGELESFHTEYRELAEIPEVREKFDAWAESRRVFAADPANRLDWQKHYFRGETPWKDPAPEHQTRLRLCPFSNATTALPAAPTPQTAPREPARPDEPPLLRAIRLRKTPMTVEVSSHSRPWMDASPQRFANRCLPLLIANQAGWCLVNDARFSVVWEGGIDPRQTVITFEDQQPAEPPISHFGHGIITWNLPFLFRTPSGWNLLARGPANAPKDGISPLEGIIETDWTFTPFTMNWKLTRPNHEVVFEPGDVICTIVPQRRHDLEAFRTVYRDLADVPEIRRQVREFSQSRRAFAADPANRLAWQKHYFRGEAPWQAPAGEHETRLRLRPFTNA